MSSGGSCAASSLLLSGCCCVYYYCCCCGVLISPGVHVGQAVHRPVSGTYGALPTGSTPVRILWGN
jgi:hypothetical protein